MIKEAWNGEPNDVAFLTIADASYRYWTDEGPESGFDVRLVYHNCLVWCYERLMPDGDLQSVMMAYDPIDYLSSRRESISDPSAVALFTFACRFLGRFAEIPVSKLMIYTILILNCTSSLVQIFPIGLGVASIVTSSWKLITGLLRTRS